MNLLNSAKLAVLGTVGLSAIGLLGVVNPADAANLLAGSDYWFTGAGTQFDFGGPIGVVQFNGVPTGPGGTDTQVTRLQNCVFDLAGLCSTPLEMRNLSLISAAPVNLGGFLYDVSVGLDPNKTTTGLMKIDHEFSDLGSIQGTFSSSLDVNFIANLISSDPNAPVIGPIFDTLNLSSDGIWSHRPQGPVIVPGAVGDLDANLHNPPPPVPPDFGDFFVVGGLNGQTVTPGVLKEKHPGQGVHVTCTKQPCPPPPPVKCGPGVPWIPGCPPGIDVFPKSWAFIDLWLLNPDGTMGPSYKDFMLSGPAIISRDEGKDGIIKTRISEKLKGLTPFGEITLIGSGTGEINDEDGDGLATSFFDVFTKIETPFGMLHSDTAAHVDGDRLLIGVSPDMILSPFDPNYFIKCPSPPAPTDPSVAVIYCGNNPVYLFDKDNKPVAVLHGERHIVHTPVPEPSTAAATIFVGLGAMFGLRKNRKSQKD